MSGYVDRDRCGNSPGWMLSFFSKLFSWCETASLSVRCVGVCVCAQVYMCAPSCIRICLRWLSSKGWPKASAVKTIPFDEVLFPQQWHRESGLSRYQCLSQPSVFGEKDLVFSWGGLHQKINYLSTQNPFSAIWKDSVDWFTVEFWGRGYFPPRFQVALCWLEIAICPVRCYFC